MATFFVKVRLIFNAYFSLQANSCRKAIKLYCPIGRGNVLECLKSLEHKKMSDHCRAAVFEEEQEEVLIQGNLFIFFLKKNLLPNYFPNPICSNSFLYTTYFFFRN